MKHRLKCGRSFSVGAQWTSTDTSEKEKKKLTGQVNVPLSTKSKSQTFTECENIEEIKDADVSIYNPVIQSKAVPQTCWNCDTHAPWEVPTWAQNTNSYNPNNSYNSPKHRPSRCLSVPPCSHSITSVADSPCSGRNMTVSQSGEALKYDTNAFFMKPETIPDVECKHPFIPDINADDLDDKTYRFQCSSPGLYKCSVTGLVFVMKGEGDVAYRCVPWNRRLLAQHHKKPAGPLFDIKCQQQSVCQLHLPHCEILSTGGGQFLQVAHVNDEGSEFIPPHTITETHVVVNITGFSGYGNVKDEDSPPDPVRALVLLFYRPPENPDLTSFLSVLLLPRNVVLRDVLHTRKRANRNERYIDIPAECKLHPKQVYTLFTAPDDDLIKVQPQEKDFDEEYHDTYFTSFQVILKRVIGDINLSLREKTTSICVWESEVCLLLTRVRTLTSPSDERLLNVRSCFTDGISGPVLNSLLDKLLDKNVITDAEKEAADVMNNRTDKARFVIDTVRRKGEAASSEMIEVLSKLDPFLCRHLGFVQGVH